MPANACVCLLLGALTAPLAAAGPAVRATSAHYDVCGDIGPETAADYACMLEQAYAKLGALLGRSPPPGRRLRVNVFRTPIGRDLALDGKLEAGGVFRYADRQCYLSVQPTAYYTRHLLLHEATHQFVCEAFGRRVDPLPAWLSEGLAEYVGHHNWDGRTLRCGQVDVVTVDGNDRLARCKRLLTEGRLNARTIVLAKAADRAPPWALVHVLLARPEWRAGLARYIQRTLAAPDGGEPTGHQAAAWFDSVFGREQLAIQAALERFVRESTRSWRLVWIDWQQRGAHLEGWSNRRYALLASNRISDCTDRVVTVTLHAEHWEQTTAGLAVGYRSPGDFRVVELFEGRFLRHMRRQGERWRDLQVHRLARPVRGQAAVPLTVASTPQGLRVRLADGPWWTIPTTAPPPHGALGLAVYRGRVTFDEPVVRPTASE